MAANNLKRQTVNPRKRLKWAVWGIVVLFVVTLFIDLIGSPNVGARAIDSALSAVPGVNSMKIWATVEKNPIDGSNRVVFKDIKEIDLQNYGPYFHLGLDLLGGSHLVYSADMANIPDGERADAIAGVRDVIERRVNALGVSEPLVQTSQVGDDWRVIVELAGVYDVDQAIKMIGETPLLEFKTENPESTKLTAEQQKQLDELNAQVEKKASDLLTQIKGGADMAQLAKQNSDDVSATETGGLITGVKRGETLPEVEDVIFNKLQVGELYQQPLKTSVGYFIIKKEAQRGSGDQIEADIRTIFLQLKTAADIGVQLEPEWVSTQLTGKNLKRSRLELDPNTGASQVALEFDSDGAKLFADITKENVGKLVAIFLDGEPISIPRVNTPILNGQAVISGNFTMNEAKLLSQRLNAGALPVSINLISQTTVGASLGNESVQKSLFAGIIGLLIVALFMVLYYRLPGLISVIALLIYTSITLAVFKMVPITMTLAGIAGFILSVGMAVDANILIFARLKEELKAGKALSVAVDEGFRRAWSSIRDSNISSLITCVILYWFGSSIIKGFALTLAIGIIISMFSAVTITRQLLRLVGGWKGLGKPWLYGASASKGEVMENNK